MFFAGAQINDAVGDDDDDGRQVVYVFALIVYDFAGSRRETGFVIGTDEAAFFELGRKHRQIFVRAKRDESFDALLGFQHDVRHAAMLQAKRLFFRQRGKFRDANEFSHNLMQRNPLKIPARRTTRRIFFVVANNADAAIAFKVALLDFGKVGNALFAQLFHQLFGRNHFLAQIAAQ